MQRQMRIFILSLITIIFSSVIFLTGFGKFKGVYICEEPPCKKWEASHIDSIEFLKKDRAMCKFRIAYRGKVETVCKYEILGNNLHITFEFGELLFSIIDDQTIELKGDKDFCDTKCSKKGK